MFGLKVKRVRSNKGKETCKGEQIFQPQLPDDLFSHHILTKLPIRDVIRFKCVSKHWCDIISSSEFAHLYTKLSRDTQHSPYTSFLIIKNGTNSYLFCHDGNDNKNLLKLSVSFDEKLELVGSCNGLVCLASSYACSFILWNPITGRVQEYDDHELVVDFSSPCKIAWGFGYVSGVDDYKVVRMIQVGETNKPTWVHVFSLKFSKWTSIAHEFYQDLFSLSPTISERFEIVANEVFLQSSDISFGLMKGVFVDETIYWIAYDATGRSRKVISFDLYSEKFASFSDFKLSADLVYKDYFLCVLGGCLSKIGVHIHNGVCIKMLKNDGKRESISLFKDLGLGSCRNLVGFTRTGKFFILLGDFELGLVDPCSKRIKYMKLLTFEWQKKSSVTGFVPTLTYIPPFASRYF